jgi:hypothetical protein
MKYLIYPFAVAALSVLAGPTFAQTSSSGQASAMAIAISPAAGDPSGSGSGDPGYGHSSSTQTIRNTPDIGIANYAGGANPCGIGGSIGVAVAGFGVGGGIATTSHECTMRAWYILLATTAEHTHDPMYIQWARGIACADVDLRTVAPPGVCTPIQVAAVAPNTAAPQLTDQFNPQAAPKPATVAMAARASSKPEWCYTVSAGDTPHAECR